MVSVDIFQQASLVCRYIVTTFTGLYSFTDATIREVDERLLDADNLFLTDGEISWTMARFNGNLTPTAEAQFLTTLFQTPIGITLTGQDLDVGPTESGNDTKRESTA